MKKNLLPLLPVIAIFAATAHHTVCAKHLVLHEKFTNTGCNPCARFAPADDSLLNMRMGDVVAITYHGHYPQPTDPFYIADKATVTTRMNLYDVPGFPSVYLNGSSILNSVAAIEPQIDRLLEDEQRVDMNLLTEVKDGVLLVKVVSTPLSTLPEGDLRLFVAALEETVLFDKPAANGQTEFHHEFRHFLHDADGYPLGTLTSEATFEESWPISGFENEDELCVVAWIQNMDTREVIEACYAPKSTNEANAAKVLLVEDASTAICSPHYSARLTFRNTGYDNLTSCNVCVDINGYVQKTPWTGNLGYLETIAFDTPDFINFELLDDGTSPNIVKCYLSDINGSETVSNTVNRNLLNSTVGQNAIEISVFTDNKPEETSWALYDDNNNLLESSEPFTEKRKFYKHVFNLASDGCYHVRFTDTGNDGIVGAYGNGYYKLSQVTTDGKTKMIVQNDFAGSDHIVFFRLENATAGVNVTAANDFGYSRENESLTIPADGVLTIVDMSGRILSSGAIREGVLSLASLPDGMYIIRLDTANGSDSLSIMK